MKKEALLYKNLDEQRVECFLCSHRCVIDQGRSGLCGVRQNNNGILQSLVYGDLIASHTDPIEKKPFYHFMPGTTAYSLATVGCNFRCGFCQNWQISQTTPHQDIFSNTRTVSPVQIVDEAVLHGADSIAYTYTEPTVFFEYAYDTARRAKDKGLHNVFVSNGYMTKAAIDMIAPVLDAANIDVKSFRDDYYRKHCKARLKPVLESIECLKRAGVWLEVTTLIIPGENDSEDELRDIAEFIAGIDIDIPWHISRFYSGYKFDSYEATPIGRLRLALDIGKECGLRHVYLGNAAEGRQTRCPNCDAVLIERSNSSVEMHALSQGMCPECQTQISGVWPPHESLQNR